MRRSREKIIADILNLCKEPTSITRIVYQNNLNFKITKRYIDMLKASGLLLEMPGYPICYKTTKKGLEFLDKLKASMDLFDFDESSK